MRGHDGAVMLAIEMAPFKNIEYDEPYSGSMIMSNTSLVCREPFHVKDSDVAEFVITTSPENDSPDVIRYRGKEVASPSDTTVIESGESEIVSCCTVSTF